MQLDLQKTQIEDQILSVITENSSSSLFDLRMAYKQFKSFDRLISAINRATEQRMSLSDMVDVLEGAHGN